MFYSSMPVWHVVHSGAVWQLEFQPHDVESFVRQDVIIPNSDVSSAYLMLLFSFCNLQAMSKYVRRESNCLSLTGTRLSALYICLCSTSTMVLCHVRMVILHPLEPSSRIKKRRILETNLHLKRREIECVACFRKELVHPICI